MIAVNINIDTSDVKSWVTRNPQKMKVAQRDLLSGMGRDFEHRLQDEATPITVTSGLHNSILSRMVGADKVAVTGINYAEIAMETGRRPGRVPPYDELKRWARLKLGNEQLGYAVAQKIAKEGTRLYRKKSPKRIRNAFLKALKIDIPKRIHYFTQAISE